MPTALTHESIFSCICEETLGFRFGEPQRPESDSLCVVVPILRETASKRQYITLSETDKVDVVDTGSINRMKVTNLSTENVFIRSGTIFKGQTQERALMRSAVAFAGRDMEVEVRCIHASRSIRPGAKTSHAGYTPIEFDSGVYRTGFRPADQSAVWARASSVSSAYHVMSSSRISSGRSASPRVPTAQVPASTPGAFDVAIPRVDDLTSHYERFTKTFDDVTARIRWVENQAGFALLTDNGVETIETFDSPLSWKAIHEDAVKRLGSRVLGKDEEGVFDFKPERAKALIRKVLAGKFTENLIYEHRPSNGELHVLILGLSGDRYVGEVVEVDGRVIHLMLIRQSP